MLSKNGIKLSIQEVSQGAWIRNGEKSAVTVGISIRPLLQYFYVHAESRNEQLIHFWSYKEFVKAIINPMSIRYPQLDPSSVKALVSLHDRLIAEHIPPFVQILLKAQVNAGIPDYSPINAQVAEGLGMYILADVQRYKIAGAMLHQVLKFQTKQKAYPSYSALVSEQMANWRALLSDTEKPYSQLNKTIDGWSGKVPKDILSLRNYHLERPLPSINARLLLAVPTGGQDFREEERDHLVHVIQITPPQDIKMLLQMPQVRVRRNQYSGNGNNPFDNLITYLKDGIRIDNTSYLHIKTLMGMWNRSFKVHEDDQHRREIANRIESEAKRKGQAAWMATKTAPLPYELPKLKEKGASIRYLDTVGAIHDEADKMGHCIASYSKQAVAGDSFLFHIEFDGEMASAEISPSGVIKQIRGPRNYMNDACDYASRILSEWIRTRSPIKPKAKKGKAVKA